MASMFDSFVRQAWADHAAQPEAVALRLRTSTPAPASAQQLTALAQLVVHLCGEHLGAFDDARWRLAALMNHPLADAGAQSALRVGVAALTLAEHGTADRGGFSLEELIRSEGSAAAISVGRKHTEHALTLLRAARARLADTPEASAAAHRPLAIACNNILWELHERGTARSPADAVAMLDVAAACRQHWSQAGTWVEVERADYGLALAHLSAGQFEQAVAFASQCLEACVAHDAPPYELFFAREALARTMHGSGDAPAWVGNVAAAEEAFARLGADDQAACRAALDKLRALVP